MGREGRDRARVSDDVPELARQDWRIDDQQIDEAHFRSFIDELRTIAADDAQVPNLRRIARASADRLEDALEAALDGNPELVRELIEGVGPEGTQSRDTLNALLPRWARGTATLDALAGVVIPNPDAVPPTVTIHWEKVPRDLRPEAASLASELVDAFYPRPKGGRPRRKKEWDETG